MTDLTQTMKKYAEAVDAALSEYLRRERIYAFREYTGSLHNAMEYALFPGGKRLRPLVLVGSCVAAGGELAGALPFACAVEMLHCYSLVHDDLPALDNADTRRSKPSVHRKFGEAMAVLAGDGLLNLAHEIMLGCCVDSFCRTNTQAAYRISVAGGVGGVVGGQAADIYHESKQAGAEALTFIHAHKTAALFGAAGYAGAMLGGAEEVLAERHCRAWTALGHAFQIKDDIENKTGNAAELGKPVQNDDENAKNTYVSVYGLDKAHDDLKERVSEGVSLLREICGGESFIVGLAEWIFESK